MVGRNGIANVLTGLVTAMALVVGYSRIRQEFFPPKAAEPPAPKVIDDWRAFAIGQRIGPPDAKVTIVEFSDFQCPFCARAAAELVDVRRRHPSDVAIVYRHYPLSFHEFAVPAARATECAALGGAFTAYHDLLFANQDSLGATPWSEFARRSSVASIPAFDRCMQDTTSGAGAIERDQKAGKKLGIRGTPAFLINDLLVAGYSKTGSLEARVAAALLKVAATDSARVAAQAGAPIGR